ncbi:SpoIID/LytB domain-containing protein [Candidatus Neptunochlamydia vexilliferae]|nr:SpoIID/LytB domain-containing protein [Candidatus Neptunochlamydia vexilliferae]
MKQFLFLFILPIFAFCAPAPQEEKPATIKVLLEKESEGILLEARGPFAVYNPENGKRVSSGRWGKRFYLYPHEEGIKWGENFLGIFQLQVVPTSANTTFLVDGVQYRGAIEIYHVEGKLSVINEVDVESYVKATLSEKVGENLPINVMDALAIIARTDAYYRALLNYESFWHVTADAVGYSGMGLTLQNIGVDRAVDNTRHLVMTFEEQPFPSSWTENCAGKTASYSSIFRKNTTTPAGVASPYVGKGRQDSHWSLTIETQELAKVVKTNRVTGIDLFVDHPSGKVYATRLHDGSHEENIDFTTLQEAIGADKLKSNDFNVSIKGNIAIFEGYGVGPGVGLCLYSAKQMAERGDDAPKILAEFFPSTQVEKMRAYPEAIISEKKSSFVSPKRKKVEKKKHRLLHR